MTLYELGNQYLLSANKLKTRMDYLKMLIKTKEKNEQRALKRRLILLTYEYYEMIKIANKLKNYYN